MNKLLFGLAFALLGAWVMAGFFIFTWPLVFYHWTPGVVHYGPFNEHFIRDVGLVYLSSGLVCLYFLVKHQWTPFFLSLSWSLLHGLYHFHFWAHRGYPLDGLFFFDLIFIIFPTYLLMWIGYTLNHRLNTKICSKDASHG